MIRLRPRPRQRRLAGLGHRAPSLPLLDATPVMPRWLTKADCPGCVALRDEHGRYALGFCDRVPGAAVCVMRAERDRRLVER